MLGQYSLGYILTYTQNMKILYVEDDQYVREETFELLKNIFQEILVAVDGKNGFELFQKNRDCDLILTDIEMPKLSGIDMIQQIREKDIQIPILVLSAHSDINYFLDTIMLGINGYILKPIDSKQLYMSMHNVVERIALKKENEEYKHHLELKVEEEIQKREYQEKILVHQNKLAMMGEMMDAVAHQWKQPLSTISMQVDLLQYSYEDNLIDKQYIDNFIAKFQQQMKHIVTTVDEFRSFLRPNKEEVVFNISKVIDSTLMLVNDEFLKNQIVFFKEIDMNITMKGRENDLKHLILNIINNAKDAFIERDLKNRSIQFKLYEEKGRIILDIIDNAGGIPNNIIGDIFKANVTTKPEGKGTGIGLYMSLKMAENFGGTLLATNFHDGAKFTFIKEY